MQFKQYATKENCNLRFQQVATSRGDHIIPQTPSWINMLIDQE